MAGAEATVPMNGQISIGTKWAGKQVRVEELSDNEIHISAGTFIPDSQKEFFTKESLESLNNVFEPSTIGFASEVNLGKASV